MSTENIENVKPSAVEPSSPAKKLKPSAAAFVSLLGESLQGKAGDVVTSEVLAGKKAVGLYFSAHWCPPCRSFTPKLGEAYTKHLKAKGLEVVFISSDRDEGAFDSYYKEQADWLALPYAARDLKAKLSKKFKVDGIPTLVILDGESGETITTDACEEVSSDPEGAKFPWRPPTFWEALGDEFLSGTEGDTVSLDEVQATSKVIGLYFSAHWCPPCRGFTPKLIEAYKEHLKAKGLEIIFVSSDRSQEDFRSYYDTQPWLAIPNGDPRKEVLSKRFGVQGIPSLVLVDAATGTEITRKARGSVGADPTGKDFPWYPKPMVDADTEGPDGINDAASLCLLLDECDTDASTAALAAFESVASAVAGAAKAAGEGAPLFFYSKEKGGHFATQIRKLCKAQAKAEPTLVLLDIPDDGGFYVSDLTSITTEGLEKFVADYKAGKLDRQQLG